MSLRLDCLGVNKFDDFSRHFRLSDSPRWSSDEACRLTIFKVNTATSHCCGANDITHINTDWFYEASPEDVQKALSFLKTINRQEYILPWDAKVFFLFIGVLETHYLSKFIELSKAKLVLTFPSKSGYGEYGHPIYQYMIDIETWDKEE